MPENGGFSLHNANRSKAVARPTARSRVSNGKDLFLDGVDGRSTLARRYRDILAQFVSDLGGDPSEAQSIIARRATTLACWCEQQEAKAAAGESLNIAEFATATNTLRRLLNDLGLERRMRDITPSIDSYLAKPEAS
jgi:hypothetical protein